MNTKKNNIKYSLTNTDIDSIFTGSNHIIKYSSLINYNNIDDVFGNNDFIILIIEEKLNSGHWTCLLRYDNTVEMFDSYGGTIDNELQYISHNQRSLLGESSHLLTKLLNQSYYDIVFPKYRFQKLQNGVNTCGRHVLCRLILFLGEGFNLNQYTKWFKTTVKKLKLSNDEYVVKLIYF